MGFGTSQTFDMLSGVCEAIIMYTDNFGYLPVVGVIEWAEGRISAVSDIEEIIANVNEHSNKDGYLYPLVIKWVRQYNNGRKEDIPKSDRPALLFRLPVTHSLILDNINGNKYDLRQDIGVFIVHFIGFLFNYRCQFDDWSVDGRIPVKGHGDYNFYNLDKAGKCIEIAYKMWKSWDDRDKRILTNILFLHSRTCKYEFDWERFMAEYQILDATYALAKKYYNVPDVPHNKRIIEICNFFNIAIDLNQIDTIVRLRNDLIHEALWDGKMPGAAPQSDNYYKHFYINSLTNRIIFSLLGIKSTYNQSSWWHMGKCYFDPIF